MFFRSTKGRKAQSSKREQKTHTTIGHCEKAGLGCASKSRVSQSDHRHIRQSSKYKHRTAFRATYNKSLVISFCCLQNLHVAKNLRLVANEE